MNFLIFLGILFFVIIIVLILWLAIIYGGKHEDPIDYTMIKNFMPQFTDNYNTGTVIEEIRGTVRHGFRFAPKDIDVIKLMKDKKLKLNIPIIWVPESHIVRFPRGTASPNRNEVWLIPQHLEQLPRPLLNTEFGKALIKLTKDKEDEKLIIDVLRASENVKNKLLKKVEGLDRVAEYLELDATLNKDIVDKIATAKGGDMHRPSFIPPPSSYGQGGM